MAKVSKIVATVPYIAPKRIARAGSASVSACEAHYRLLHKSCGAVLNESFKRFGKQHCASHNYISDLNTWGSVINERPELPMLRLAIREYQFALLALSLGKYRNAFISLRVFLELSLSLVQFSANEFKLREWLKGVRDVNWQSLIDTNEGIFSTPFVNAFYEDLADEAPLYRSIAEKVYRECSEYVHGNVSVAVPPQVTFDATLYQEWHQKAQHCILVFHFAFFLRYACTLTSQHRRRIEPIALDELGHIAAIRAYFGATI